MTIGTLAHADEARSLNMDEPLPAEWEHLGSGCYRNAFLHRPTGVVYKVQRNGAVGMGNTGEYEKALTLSTMEWDRVRIPAVALYSFGENFQDEKQRPVLAMEWIQGVLGGGQGYPDHPGWREFTSAKVCGDMHPQNFIIDTKGYMVPIDLACEW